MKISTSDHFLFIDIDGENTIPSFGLDQVNLLSKHMRKPDLKGVVLRGRGRIFTAGGNLKHYASLKEKDQGVEINNYIRDFMNQFSQWPVPKLALISGDCFGGGIEWLSTFDHLCATPEAFFAMWQGRQGLSYGWGGYQRLLARVSERNLHHWVMTGSVLSAHRALSLGLVDRVVPSHQLSHVFESWKKRLGRVPAVSEIHECLASDEAQLFNDLWWSPEHQKKLDRFR